MGSALARGIPPEPNWWAPAALVIMLMPFSYSITNGIGFGFIAYVLIRAAQARAREVHPLMWAVSAAFALYFFVPLLQDHLSWI